MTGRTTVEDFEDSVEAAVERIMRYHSSKLTGSAILRPNESEWNLVTGGKLLQIIHLRYGIFMLHEGLSRPVYVDNPYAIDEWCRCTAGTYMEEGYVQ